MAHPNSTLNPLRVASTNPVAEAASSIEVSELREVGNLLRRAAKLSAERGMESDVFMQEAWEACLNARPGLRAELEDRELRAQLKKLRKRGLVARA